MASISRREAIKIIGVGAGALVAGNLAWVVKALASDEATIRTLEKTVWYAPPPSSNTKYAMVIDVKACIGCRRCAYACVNENNIDPNTGIRYIQLLELEKGKSELELADPYYEKAPKKDKWYLPIQCMQCENPPCVKACPVQATWSDPDGIVVIDYNKCIGCRNCMSACPYGARHFNWKEPELEKQNVNKDVPVRSTGVVEKCTFCIHRVREGKTTKCTEACPVGARKFGNLYDPESSVRKILEGQHVFRLKEEMGTEPLIYYVG